MVEHASQSARPSYFTAATASLLMLCVAKATLHLGELQVEKEKRAENLRREKIEHQQARRLFREQQRIRRLELHGDVYTKAFQFLHFWQGHLPRRYTSFFARHVQVRAETARDAYHPAIRRRDGRYVDYVYNPQLGAVSEIIVDGSISNEQLARSRGRIIDLMMAHNAKVKKDRINYGYQLSYQPVHDMQIGKVPTNPPLGVMSFALYPVGFSMNDHKPARLPSGYTISPGLGALHDGSGIIKEFVKGKLRRK